MALENPWIKYVTRSYQQIKDEVLQNMQTLVPEITDHTEANPYVKMISIWAGITEMLGYYLDNKARELYLSTMRRFYNGALLAEQYDYRIKGSVAATVDVKFFFSTQVTGIVTIPEGTEIKTVEGIKFFTTEEVTIPIGGIDVTVACINQEAILGTVLGNSTGDTNQKFALVAEVVDDSISLTAAGTNVYTSVDTFVFSLKTDQVFIGGLNTDKVMEVRLGDGLNGLIPPAGQELVVDYAVSDGENGNVGVGTITEVVGAVTVPSGYTLQVTNILAASGGGNSESLEELKVNMPKSIRTLNRGVTKKDYEDLAELFQGVQRAGVEFDCGKLIDIYIVPTGGGIASSALLQGLEDYFDDKKMITTFINAQAAGEVILKLEVDVNVFSNYANAVVEADIKEALTNFLSVENQDIRGTVVLGDLYEQIETTTGVKNSNILSIKPIPHGRPIAHDTPLDWVRVVDGITESTSWSIVIISGTDYELFRANSFIGSFSFGVEVVNTGLTFTVNASGSYAVGNTWTFVTYPVNRNLVLEEPSLIVANDEDITLNIIGGQ